MTDQRPYHDLGEPGHGVSRRTVVRTAGKAAWAAPVIVVATSTPARAASGVALDVVSLTATRPTLSTTINVGFTVQNLGGPQSNIQVLVVVTPDLEAIFNAGSVGGSGGFVAGTPTPNGLLGFQVVFTRAASLASDSTAACTFSFTSLLSGGSVTAQVISPSGDNNTAADTY